MSNFFVALIFSTLAGLSTTIGGLIVLFKKNLSAKFLSFSLSFSCGVMLYISFTELLNSASEMFLENYVQKTSAIFVALAFFIGLILMAILDMLLPDENSPSKFVKISKIGEPKQNKKLLRSGILTAIAIALHNFPEGLTTFTISATSLSFALPIIVAIAIHNIPEGIAVSAPIFKATGSKKKAFLWAMVSGLTEPIGGLIGYLLLAPFITTFVLGCMYAIIAGIMVYVSLEELFPLAKEYDKTKSSFFGLLWGMIVMSVSLILFM